MNHLAHSFGVALLMAAVGLQCTTDDAMKDASDVETADTACESPAPGCPCDPRTDRGCCLDIGIGIMCIGTVQGRWETISGCGCGAPPCGDFAEVELCPGAP